jgi:hypothetical protein
VELGEGMTVEDSAGTGDWDTSSAGPEQLIPRARIASAIVPAITFFHPSNKARSPSASKWHKRLSLMPIIIGQIACPTTARRAPLQLARGTRLC